MVSIELIFRESCQQIKIVQESNKMQSSGFIWSELK